MLGVLGRLLDDDLEMLAVSTEPLSEKESS